MAASTPAGVAHLTGLLTTYKTLYPGSALAGLMSGGGGPGGIEGGPGGLQKSYTIGEDGKVSVRMTPGPQPTAPTAIEAQGKALGYDVKRGLRPDGTPMDASDWKKIGDASEATAQRVSAARGVGFQASRAVQAWDTVKKISVPMDLKSVQDANAKEPGRFRVLAEPGVQQEAKMGIEDPWNLHPLTKADARIPVDVKSLNRLDAKVTPDEFKADQKSGQPGMVLMNRKDWSDVIAPIRGVWKSYQEVSNDIQKQLGVTTPDAVITRLETAGAAALGSSKLAVDVKAQVSHAIRMLRAMGVKGNMAS